MNGRRNEKRQEILRKKKCLHCEDEVEHERRERHAPAHRGPGDGDEEYVGGES